MTIRVEDKHPSPRGCKSEFRVDCFFFVSVGYNILAERIATRRGKASFTSFVAVIAYKTIAKTKFVFEKSVEKENLEFGSVDLKVN